MIIPIFAFSNLAEYTAAGGSVRVPKPEVCPSCKKSGCLRRHTGYTRWAQDAGGKPVAVRVERFLCRSCSKVLSALYSFLMPYRRFSATGIKRFAEIFEEKLQRAYLEDLWAIAYIAFGGCSDDGFLYFRAWLISEGQQIFEAALRNPEGLADLVEQPLELAG